MALMDAVGRAQVLCQKHVTERVPEELVCIALWDVLLRHVPSFNGC